MCKITIYITVMDFLKIYFFYRPFREYNAKTGQKTWNSVDRLEKGTFYQEVRCRVI